MAITPNKNTRQKDSLIESTSTTGQVARAVISPGGLDVSVYNAAQLSLDFFLANGGDIDDLLVDDQGEVIIDDQGNFLLAT